MPNDNARSFPLVLIISLAESLERRGYLTAQLNDLGVPYHVIDAVDGRGFDVAHYPDYDRRKRLSYFGKDFLGGELGCLLSHKKALEYVVAHHLPVAVIFEDDTVIENGLEFLKLMELLSKPVSDSETKLAHKLDLVRMIGKKKVYQSPYKILSHLTPDTKLARTQGIPGSANAYFISCSGAEKLLRFLSKPYLPIDILMGHSWMTGVDNLIIVPSPVHDRYWNHSYIGDDRFKAAQPAKTDGHKRALPAHSWHKTYFKITTALLKRLNFHWRNIG